MTRLITIVLIGFVLLLGYLGNDVAIDAPVLLKLNLLAALMRMLRRHRRVLICRI